MKKQTRKNFLFNSDILFKAEAKAQRQKMSLTKYLECLMEADSQKDAKEFFAYLDKRNKK